MHLIEQKTRGVENDFQIDAARLFLHLLNEATRYLDDAPNRSEHFVVAAGTHHLD
jgi:hypothetical protein